MSGLVLRSHRISSKVPMSDEKWGKIQIGDRVRVTGGVPALPGVWFHGVVECTYPYMVGVRVSESNDPDLMDCYVPADRPKGSPQLREHLAAAVRSGVTSGFDFIGETSVPAPVTYDGLTSEQCLEAWLHLQREDRWVGVNMHGDTLSLRYPRLTALQLRAAGDAWSAELRAKVEASKERAQLTVMVDVDVEDEPW